MALPMQAPQGGLGQMAPPQENPDAVEANLISKTEDQPKPPMDFAAQKSADLEAQRKVLDARRAHLESRLTERQTPMFDPGLMRLAAGFLKPTRTGSFGESAGYAAEGLNEQNERDYARKMQEQKMMEDLQDKQFAFQQQINDANRQSQIGQAASSIYAPVKDANGVETYKYNPAAAQTLARLTGDPNIVKQIADEQRKQRIQESGNNMMMPTVTKKEDGTESTSYKINPDAVKQIMALAGPEEVTKYMKSFSEMRKLGLVGDMTKEGTPFDAIIAMNPSAALTDQARRLASQYTKGIIDEDKANQLAQSMITVATSHMDRAQASAFNQQMASMNHMLAVSNNQMARDRLDAKLREEAKALSPQEKMDYKERVLPILKKGESAQEARDKLKVIADKFATAPEGALEGVFANSLGRLFNTDQALALRQIDQLTKELMPSVPRLPGSASDRDAKNILDGLGHLADPKLDNKSRYKIIKDLDEAYKRIADRAAAIDTYWETNKKVPAYVSENRPPEGTPAAPTSKFKVIGTEPAKAP